MVQVLNANQLADWLKNPHGNRRNLLLARNLFAKLWHEISLFFLARSIDKKNKLN